MRRAHGGNAPDLPYPPCPPCPVPVLPMYDLMTRRSGEGRERFKVCAIRAREYWHKPPRPSPESSASAMPCHSIRPFDLRLSKPLAFMALPNAVGVPGSSRSAAHHFSKALNSSVLPARMAGMHRQRCAQPIGAAGQAEDAVHRGPQGGRRGAGVDAGGDGAVGDAVAQGCGEFGVLLFDEVGDTFERGRSWPP